MVTRLSPQQVQKTILAPAMQQSIEVLLLPLIDLEQAIEQELLENPLLEINEERSERAEKELQDEIDRRLKHDEQTAELPYYGSYNDDEMIEDRPLKLEVSLEDSLLQQMRIELRCPQEQQIGELIIGNLDEDGYLKISVEEIAEIAQTSDVQLVEHVRTMIQALEPTGVASLNLKDCLLCQASAKYNGRNKYIYDIINSYLKELSQKKFTWIAKKLKTSEDNIREAVTLITKLDPKPARNHRTESPSIYIKPDIYITQNSDNQYQIHINDEGIPRLRISPFYKSMLQTGKLGPDERNFIREKIKNALLFMRSIEQRGQTVRGIASYILQRQKDFFEQGYSALTPMSLKDVASALGRNESTISRAVNNKYVDTPRGIFPLKFFFSQGVCERNDGAAGSEVASRSIKEEIKELIQSENKSKPYSDSDIQKHFEGKGVKIARRTISKYRQASRILPSHLRKY